MGTALSRRQVDNLDRLNGSELFKAMVAEHPFGWDEGVWKQQIDTLKASGYWPIREDQVKQLMTDAIQVPATQAPVRDRTGPTWDAVSSCDKLADAAWANPVDFAKRHKYQKGDLWLGRSPIDGTPLGYNDDKHVVLGCATRGGKGTTTIIPNHLLWPGSLVSIDPKGENASVAAARRGDGNDRCIGMGQSVNVLDPFNVATVEEKYRKRFNPLDALDQDDLDEPVSIDRAASLAEAIITRTGNESDDYWKGDAEGAIRALLLHIKTAPEFEGRRNLITLRQLIMRGDLRTWKLLKDAGDTDVPDPMSLLFARMIRNEACGDVIAGMGASLQEMKMQGDKQWIGVRGALRTQTQFLDSRKLQACLEVSDFSLSELKNNPKGMSLFLSLPGSEMATYKGWLRIMINMIKCEVCKSLAKSACGYRVLMCLDEFAELDRLKEIESSIAVLAGFDVKLIIVVQGLYQLQDKYKENWQAFLGNASVQQYFALGRETVTQKHVSELIGETEVVKYGINEGKGITAQRTKSIQKSMSSSRGGSHGRTDSNSKSLSQSKTVGSADGVSEGDSKSVGGGRNRNASKNSSKNQGWNPPRFFFRDTHKYLPFLRSGEKAGIQSGTSQSCGDSTNWTRGKNRSRSHQDSTSETRNEALTESTANNKSVMWQESMNVGEQEGTAQGMSYNVGTQQSFHKRPLIYHNDIAKFFARLKDENDPCFPGLGLVLVDDEDPMVVQRTNYFEDPEFDGLWDDHPSHPETVPQLLVRTMPLTVTGNARGGLWEEEHEPVIAGWHKKAGDRVAKGERLLDIMPGPSFTGLVNTILPINAPVTGTLERITASKGEPFNFGKTLGVIQYHQATARKQRHITVPNELDAYNREDHPGYAEFVEHDRAEAKRKRERQAEEERSRHEKTLALKLKAEQQAEAKKAFFEKNEWGILAGIAIAAAVGFVSFWAFVLAINLIELFWIPQGPIMGPTAGRAIAYAWLLLCIVSGAFSVSMHNESLETAWEAHDSKNNQSE